MITKMMYSRALRLQDEEELLPIACVLKTWLGVIEDDFSERGFNATLVHRHPVVIMLTYKIFSLVFPKGVESPLRDLRVMPGVYVRFLVQWLINVLNDYRGTLALTFVDGEFLNFYQLVEWIVMCIAETTHCTNIRLFAKAYDLCSHVNSLTEEEAYSGLRKEMSTLHCVSVVGTSPRIASVDLTRALQTFKQVITDATLLQELENKTLFSDFTEQKDNLTLC